MDLMFILSQTCGVIALIVGCCGYFSKTKSKFLIFQAICDLFYAGAYLFLGSFVAGFITVLSVIKSIVFYFCQKHNFKYDYLFLILFIVLNIVITIVFWKSPIDIVPLITSTLFVYIMFIKNIQATKCLTLIPNSILFVYNISLKAYANGALSLIEIIVTIVAIIKFNKELKNKNLGNEKMNNDLQNTN